MWVEVSPDGRWIWTSSGTHLLVYRASDINSEVARATAGRNDGRDRWRRPRSRLAHRRRDRRGVLHRAVHAHTSSPARAQPRNILGDRLLQTQQTGVVYRGSRATRRHRSITMPQSFFDNESEGLAITRPSTCLSRSAACCRWQILPVITLLSLYSRILTYVPPVDDTHGAEGRARSARGASPRLQRVGGPALHRAERLKIVAALRQH